MLQTVAPRPWAKRMLAWHMFETVGFLEFSSGTLTEMMIAYHVLKASEAVNAQVHPSCETVARAEAASQFEDVILEEHEPEFPFALPIEVILQIDHFDWESGTARGDLRHVDLINGDFYEDLLAQRKDSWLAFDLAGLSFPLSLIEMLAPNASPPPEDLFSLEKLKGTDRIAGPGRRRKHDWDGALLHLIGEAERNAIAPDPDAHGAQADIVKLMADWFADNGAAIPANSQLQAKAKQVLEQVRAANPKPR